MTRIVTQLGLLSNATETTSNSIDALKAAHKAAQDLGFNIGVAVKFKNTGHSGIVSGFNTIRHEGMRMTGERAPLIIRHSDGTEREHSTGELEIVK